MGHLDTHPIRTLAGLLAIAALLATPAWADGEEPPSAADRVGALGRQMTVHARAGAADALVADLGQAVQIYRGIQTREDAPEAAVKRARKALVKLVGKWTRGQDDAVEKAALETLGKLGHADGARYVKACLKPARKDSVDPSLLVAIDVAGILVDDALARPLLKVAEDSKYSAVSARAMKALAHYGACTKHRERIVLDLVKLVRKYRPGVRGPGKRIRADPEGGYISNNSGEGTRQRWRVLAPVLTDTLNGLTGQRLAAAEDWIAHVEANKRRLRDLFKDDA